ncbi:MAG: hypothetical protein KDC67_09235 [Ignavibacteriae bacterium]|nr:hypothetical protein [Ignavibacteriota bacterium]
MSWQLIEYNTYSGKYNMEFDLQLVKNCFSNEAFLRFYGWEPHCISLGANQSYDDINQELTTKNNIDVVKRPTGGRSILHSDELTYSVVMPNNQQLSGRTLYEKISKAIIIGLAKYDSMLEKVMLENQQPNFQQLLNQPSGSLCFASTAKSEIKFEGKKLVGSAQRKLGNTILQHGSILIGPNHKSLVDYLNLDEELKLNLQNEMEMKTTEISTILNKHVNILELEKNIVFGFNKIFNSQLSINEFSSLPTL